jgi:hypothetical protein
VTSSPIPITLNAWTGSEKAAGLIGSPARWALQRKLEFAQRLLAPTTVDLLNWKDPHVGWGVVLADGAKIPPRLQELIDARNGPIFSYIAKWEYEFILLRNRRVGKDIDINGAPRGTAPDALPYYLLIYGSPAEVPWQLQYVLNANRCVGRLDLTGPALDNYIGALLTGDWGRGSPPAEATDPNRALVWAVAHGEDDITDLMRNAIAAPLFEDLQEDDQIGAGARFLDGAANPAEIAQLTEKLASDRPGLIVTTSHGMTGPLGDGEEVKAAMRRNLGLPVDVTGEVLNPGALLAKWQPAGAIWYAHACCSAGGDSKSSFADLVDSDSIAGKVLAGVASLGAQIAPLPTALLGAERPLRAFIGHVEPTFDWTLRQIATGQFLTASILEALYGRMYVQKGDSEKPIGHAFRDWYGRTNGLRSQYDKAKTQLNEGGSTEGILLALQLAARDVESTVILGDPTVAMPGLV